MHEHNDDRQQMALYTAAHAVAEAQYGDPFERVAIHEGTPQWLEREDSLDWKTREQAEKVLIRLSVGLAVAESGPATLHSQAYVMRDTQKRRDHLRKLYPDGQLDELESEWTKRAETFLSEPSNARALKLITDDLLVYGWLRMEEIDFLIDAAQGDADALEALAQFRKLYDVIPVTWPDDT